MSVPSAIKFSIEGFSLDIRLRSGQNCILPTLRIRGKTAARTLKVKPMLTANALAMAYKVHPKTIYRLKLQGHLPYFQPGGKHHFVRFPETLLETPIESTPKAVHGNATPKDTIPGRKPKWQTEE